MAVKFISRRSQAPRDPGSELCKSCLEGVARGKQAQGMLKHCSSVGCKAWKVRGDRKPVFRRECALEMMQQVSTVNCQFSDCYVNIAIAVLTALAEAEPGNARLCKGGLKAFQENATTP